MGNILLRFDVAIFSDIVLLFADKGGRVIVLENSRMSKNKVLCGYPQ
ncbi:MAG: hypothetical protein KAG20_07065 [Cocleimonas sp.]|nr:hypothetical protein [Cocleimonas sp.]